MGCFGTLLNGAVSLNSAASHFKADALIQDPVITNVTIAPISADTATR